MKQSKKRRLAAIFLAVSFLSLVVTGIIHPVMCHRTFAHIHVFSAIVMVVSLGFHLSANKKMFLAHLGLGTSVK